MPLIPALLLAAAAFAAAPVAPAKPCAFKTADGWTIAAVYRAPRKGRPVVILAHGVASSKGEWGGFSERLAADGVGTLALDLRGHLQSRKGPDGRERGFETFRADDWAAAAGDLTAAFDWLKARGVPSARIAFGGASVGANLAALAASRRKGAPFLLLLSPGEDYRGVSLALPTGPHILIASSRPDPFAFQTMQESAKSPGVETLEAPRGHGAQMFEDPATLDAIAKWIAAQPVK